MIGLSKRKLMKTTALSFLWFAGCSSQLAGGANLALTNASSETATISVTITERSNEDTLLDESYQVPPSDDGLLVEDVVSSSGEYTVEAAVESSDEHAESRWRIPSNNNPRNYSIRVGLLSDRSLNISGDGV